MRRKIIVMFCLLLGFSLGPLQAAPEQAAQSIPNRGALFKLQRDGHTAWLFGTIHVGAPDFYPLEPRVMAALDRATAVALEVDPRGDNGKLMQAVRQYGMYAAGGGPASAEIGAAYRPRLARLLTQYGIASAAVAPMKPWMLASVLTVSEFAAQGYSSELAVDSWLSQRAHQRKQKVVELESAASQMALFDRMTSAEQARFLEDGIDAIEDKEQGVQPRDIAQAWRSADRAKLEALAQKAAEDDTFSGKFVQKVLLDERNPQLADAIVRLMSKEQHGFAAIGILHLVGTDSVPELLRRRGVAVERIY
jgi:uncharacterized protein YbaP (TraB family)